MLILCASVVTREKLKEVSETIVAIHHIVNWTRRYRKHITVFWFGVFWFEGKGAITKSMQVYQRASPTTPCIQCIKPTLIWCMLVLQYIMLRLVLSPSRRKRKRTQGNNWILFYNRIGGWRVSKYADSKLPNELYQVAENHTVELPASKLFIEIDESDTDDIARKIETVKQVQ